MMLPESWNLVLAVVAGIALGLVFFGGLWWTIQRGAASRYPAVWFGLSGVLRMAIILGGFYLVAGGRWQRLLLCLAGFVISRLVVTRVTRSVLRAPDVVAGKGSHAAQP
jgi:F1F0 ATPase subunit 2